MKYHENEDWWECRYETIFIFCVIPIFVRTCGVNNYAIVVCFAISWMWKDNVKIS